MHMQAVHTHHTHKHCSILLYVYVLGQNVHNVHESSIVMNATAGDPISTRGDWPVEIIITTPSMVDTIKVASRWHQGGIDV